MLPHQNTDTRWTHALSRTALVAALVSVALFVSFAALSSEAGDPSLPEEARAFIAASANPLSERLLETMDVAQYLSQSAFFLIFALALWRAAPVRAALVSTAAAGWLIAALGGYIWLTAGNVLTSRYALADAAARPAVLGDFLVQWQVIQAHFQLGAVVASIAFLLIASVARSALGVPRWLTLWIGASGAYSLGERIVVAIGGRDVPFFPFDLVYILVGVIALQFAIAKVLWSAPTTTERQT